MRRTALIISLLMALPVAASADEPPVPAASPELTKLLETLRSETDPNSRLDAAKKLTELDPIPLEALRRHLNRRRASSDKERRKVLRKIKAEVPDHKGKFRRRKYRRKKAKRVQAADKFDWLAELVKLPSDTKGLSDVIVDVAIIRAMAASKSAAGGYAVLEFGFKNGLIYRDECGRYLRKMHPYSIPALIEGAGQRRNYSFTRYSVYQLERLDRQSSDKALNAASGDTNLKIAVLHAFGKVRYRDAVRVVWKEINHHVPVVRKAARKAWMRYVSGKPPRPAPKRKLQMTGGEYTPTKKKLWLNSRELARVMLVEAYEKIFSKKARDSMSEETLTKKLFAHFDAERSKRAEAAFLDAKNQIANGNYAAATTVFDRILARDVDHPRRAEMAPAFLAHARALAAKGEWRTAAAAFRKANLLDPAGADSKTALAWHHYALGRALQADGANGKPELRKALAIDPGFSDAKAALAGRAPKVANGVNGSAKKKGDRSWMLYAGIGGGGVALLLLAVGLFLRRR